MSVAISHGASAAEPMSQAAATDLPRRHLSDVVRARRAASLIVGQLPRGTPEPSEAEFRHIGEGLWLGDAAADRLVNWMHRRGMREAWPLVQQAIELGVGGLPGLAPDADAELRAFFDAVEARPAWVRDELLEEGARVCGLGGRAGMRALAVTGLMAGYQLAAVNQALLATGALEKGAARRIAETTKWWIDVTEPGAMTRFGEGFKGTLRVRIIHAMVRRQLSQRPSWDAADLGLPVNQTDMQATYLGFSIVYLLGLKLVGVPLRGDEKEAVLHLWRYIAWVNGVREDHLHAQDVTEAGAEGGAEQAAMRLLHANLLTQRMADADSARLARALADEPLHRHYARWPVLTGRFNRAMQLSIARACMGNDTLRGLGLPVWRLPWYPLAMMAFHQPLHRLMRALPGGRERLMAWGRRRQRAYLPILFGEQAPALRELATVKAGAASSTAS
ncbi:MAG: DUF2236 domain-containing protein [Proteobacteria bacterium]|uniref:oxygenase MpaB family protein n=1 Tax=Aquabacterium sp. TaxID=1872578 RepID=UPI0035C68992|nr:DUF2236 domain-containing protein [Pseudomonadota bacterium]